MMRWVLFLLQDFSDLVVDSLELAVLESKFFMFELTMEMADDKFVRFNLLLVVDSMEMADENL
jgi:hypothetical protein